MDSEVKLYLERAENELVLAEASFELSINDIAKETLKVPKNRTFYSNVISQAYYAIFYSAKAYLLNKGVKTKTPDEHKKTYKEFKKLVKQGIIDKELLEIYEDAVIKASSLLMIFKEEKWKRVHFTYHINASANKPFAENSLENSKKFLANILKMFDFIEDKKEEK